MKNYINYLLVFFCIVYSTFLVLKRKTYWDAIPYMGAVIAIEEHDTKKVHAKTYQLLKERTSPDEQQKLIYGHPFCESVYKHPDYFTQQLPFFQVKLLYIYTSYLFYKTGFPLYDALFFVVIISSVLIFLVIYKWLNIYYGNAFSLLFSVLLFLCWFNVRTFRISSPDALAALFLLLSVYNFLEKKNIKMTYMFVGLAALTRPDYLFYILSFYCISNLCLKTKPTLVATISTVACIVAILFISDVFKYSGWQMFYRSFIELTVSPQTSAGKFSSDLYFTGIYNGIKQSASHLSTYLFIMVFILPVFLWKKLSGNEKIIYFSILASSFIRFFIHPWLEERFVFIYLNIFFVLLLKHMSPSKITFKNLKVLS